MKNYSTVVVARQDNRLIDSQEVRGNKSAVSKVPEYPHSSSEFLLNRVYLCLHVRRGGKVKAKNFHTLRFFYQSAVIIMEI